MTLSYDEIRDRSNSAIPVSKEGAESIRGEYPFLPQDYISLLTEVGWGEICGLMFYSGPSELDDVFDEATVQASPRIVLVADDLSGGHLGYTSVGGRWVLTFFDHIELPDVTPRAESTLTEFLTWWSDPV